MLHNDTKEVRAHRKKELFELGVPQPLPGAKRCCIPARPPRAGPDEDRGEDDLRERCLHRLHPQR